MTLSLFFRLDQIKTRKRLTALTQESEGQFVYDSGDKQYHVKNTSRPGQKSI